MLGGAEPFGALDDLRVLVVSGSRLHREGLAIQLSAEPGLRPVGTTASLRDARRLAAGDAVDVVLLDVEPTRLHRAEVAAAVSANPEVRFVTMLASDGDTDLLAWAEAGVSGVVDHTSSPAELREVLHAAVRGDVLCSPRVAGVLLRRVRALAQAARQVEPAERLTERERHVLRLIGLGLSNKEIARELGLRLATVKNHTHRIFDKLEVRSRTMAVSAAHLLDSTADSTSTTGSAVK